jgi:hypothetical protein
MSEQDILTAASDLEIGISSEFIPHSKSRNAKEAKCLNWKVTLSVKGREVLTTDYSAGVAHCPSYSDQWNNMCISAQEKVEHECEMGTNWHVYPTSRKPILPKMADVLSSLVTDASAINAGSFEEWCSEMGADSDSRKAEATYTACLKIGLQMQRAFGMVGMEQLQKACQDY